MASEGMNIKRLNTLVLATSKKDVEQTVGRIMRELVESRTTVHICLDFNDAHNCLRGQQNARRQFYKSNKYEIVEIQMNDARRFNMDILLKPLPEMKTELEITVSKGKKKVQPAKTVKKEFGKPLCYGESISAEEIECPWLYAAKIPLLPGEEIDVPPEYRKAEVDMDESDWGDGEWHLKE